MAHTRTWLDVSVDDAFRVEVGKAVGQGHEHQGSHLTLRDVALHSFVDAVEVAIPSVLLDQHNVFAVPEYTVQGNDVAVVHFQVRLHLPNYHVEYVGRNLVEEVDLECHNHIAVKAFGLQAISEM
jgi:hypothetical protein